MNTVPRSLVSLPSKLDGWITLCYCMCDVCGKSLHPILCVRTTEVPAEVEEKERRKQRREKPGWKG